MVLLERKLGQTSREKTKKEEPGTTPTGGKKKEKGDKDEKVAWVGAGDLPNMEKAKGVHVPYWAKKGCPVVHMEPQHMFAERLSKELTIVASGGDSTASVVAGGGSSSGGDTHGGGGGDVAAGEPHTVQSWDRGGGKWVDNGKKENETGWLNKCKLLVDALVEANDMDKAMELAVEFHGHPSMVMARNDGGGGKRKWSED